MRLALRALFSLVLGLLSAFALLDFAKSSPNDFTALGRALGCAAIAAIPWIAMDKTSIRSSSVFLLVGIGSLLMAFDILQPHRTFPEKCMLDGLCTVQNWLYHAGGRPLAMLPTGLFGVGCTVSAIYSIVAQIRVRWREKEANREEKAAYQTHSPSQIAASFVEPCPVCGADCTGTIHLSYTSAERRVIFEANQCYLSQSLERLIDVANERGAYTQLPQFVREWNEARGWAEFTSDGGTVSPSDVLQTLDTIAVQRIAIDGRADEVLTELRSFVQDAARNGVDLWVRED